MTLIDTFFKFIWFIIHASNVTVTYYILDPRLVDDEKVINEKTKKQLTHMKVVKAHVLAYVDAAHAILTEHKAVGTLADEAAVCVDARSALADPATVLALVHIYQHTLYRI